MRKEEGGGINSLNLSSPPWLTHCLCFLLCSARNRTSETLSATSLAKWTASKSSGTMPHTNQRGEGLTSNINQPHRASLCVCVCESVCVCVCVCV